MIKILKFIFFNVVLGLTDVTSDLATFFTLVENHLNRKVVAWTRKGVTIHEAVKMAHRG